MFAIVSVALCSLSGCAKASDEEPSGTEKTKPAAASANADGSVATGEPPERVGRWLTGKPGTRLGKGGAEWTDTVRHAYSKIQPWNCDQSLLVLINRGAPREITFIVSPQPGKQPLSAEKVKAGQVSFLRAVPGTEARWLPDDPGRMLYVADDTIGLWQVEKDKTDLLYRFDDLHQLQIGPWEGNLSNDGERVVVTGKRRQGDVPVSVLFDRQAGKELARYVHPPDLTVDWVSVSAGGRYIVLNGQVEADGQDQTQVFDDHFEPVGEPWLAYGRPSHYDLAVDENGDDVAIGVSKSAPDDGLVIKRRLRDGAVTVLTDAGYASHASTRNIGLPGWAFITYQGELPDYPPYANEVVAVRTEGSGEVVRIAAFPNAGDDYWAQPQAVASPDGSMVLWARTWPAKVARTGATNSELPAIGTALTRTNLPLPDEDCSTCEPACR